MYNILMGDMFNLLDKLPYGYYDALITDPPYSSQIGTAKGLKKYSSSANVQTVRMANDDMDQRSWINWTAEWLIKASRILKMGSPFVIFTDWRQLPALSDAIKYAGLRQRGLIPWDKRNSRPFEGGFRNQCEYCVWGSLGQLKGNKNLYLPGFYSINIVPPPKRIHAMEKPLALMRELVKITRTGGRVLDPFCGSGTTVAAALLEGYDAVGIEIDEDMAAKAKDRIELILSSHAEAV